MKWFDLYLRSISPAFFLLSLLQAHWTCFYIAIVFRSRRNNCKSIFYSGSPGLKSLFRKNTCYNASCWKRGHAAGLPEPEFEPHQWSWFTTEARCPSHKKLKLRIAPIKTPWRKADYGSSYFCYHCNTSKIKPIAWFLLQVLAECRDRHAARGGFVPPRTKSGTGRFDGWAKEKIIGQMARQTVSTTPEAGGPPAPELENELAFVAKGFWSREKTLLKILIPLLSFISSALLCLIFTAQFSKIEWAVDAVLEIRLQERLRAKEKPACWYCSVLLLVNDIFNYNCSLGAVIYDNMPAKKIRSKAWRQGSCLCQRTEDSEPKPHGGQRSMRPCFP